MTKNITQYHLIHAFEAVGLNAETMSGNNLKMIFTVKTGIIFLMNKVMMLVFGGAKASGTLTNTSFTTNAGVLDHN